MNVILRLRDETESGLVTGWLICEEGKDVKAQSCLLYGVLSKEKADDLAVLMENAGLKVERKTCDDKRMDEPRPETVKVKQEQLFKESQ